MRLAKSFYDNFFNIFVNFFNIFNRFNIFMITTSLSVLTLNETTFINKFKHLATTRGIQAKEMCFFFLNSDFDLICKIN